MQITDNEIRGRKVIAADGNAIGQVGDLIIDSERWAVEFVQIKLRKEVADAFGATHGIFHSGVMEIPVRMVQSLGDTIVLAVPTADLRSVVPGATTNRGAKAAD